MLDKMFLQFGEAANMSMIHLWNYLSLTPETEEDSKVRRALLPAGTQPKTLIYSERTGLKGIISQGRSEETLNEEDRDLLINQKTGRWTDMNYGTEFPESSYREIDQFDPNCSFISSFYDSKSKSSFLDVFEEDSRKLAEKCDWMERFNLVSEGCGSIGASTLHSLEYLNDEFTKSSKFVLSFDERVKVESINSIHWDNLDAFDGDYVGKALKLSLTFEAIKDHNVTLVPICPLSRCTWNPISFHLSDSIEACRYFSAIEFDIFGQQSVPCQGKFGSLINSIPNHQPFNFTTNQFIGNSLNKWRKAPIVVDVKDYKFENVDLISYIDFNPSPMCNRASEYLKNVLNRPRPVWQLLESVNSASELAAGDYYQEILESLHQIKDLAEISE